MDDADRSDQTIEQRIEDGIERARRHAARSLPYIGVCHYCEGAVGAGRTFCCKGCSDDYDWLLQQNRRNGK